MESQDADSDNHSQPWLLSQEPIKFDWGTKWLKGHEYAFILNHLEQYCEKFGFKKYPHKTHPQQIYQNPQNGSIYFVEGKGVGPQFGFPRVPIKKKFRWKKMNFTTHLPKKHPLVTYVVASAITSKNIQYPLFRMHAAVIYHDQQHPCNYILCHVREMQKKQPQNVHTWLRQNQPINFYKLFAFLHNYQYLNS